MLIITGTLAYDHIMDFPGLFEQHILPEKIHNISLSFIVDKFTKRRGGTAGNVSYSLALLDTPHILLSSAGKDFDEYKAAFKGMGINLNHIKVYDEEYTSTGFAMTDRKNNQIWAYSYGATNHNQELKIKEVAKKDDLVLIGPQGSKGTLSLVRQCVEEEVPFMLDPGFILTEVSDSDLSYAVKHTRYLIGNDYEISLMKKRVKDYEKNLERRTVITTLGKRGAIIEDAGQIIVVKPAISGKVHDPTGAGDSWRSGFLAGLERKLDLLTCGEMGSVVASYVVENVGTQEHKFTKQEFAKRYEESYSKTLKVLT